MKRRGVIFTTDALGGILVMIALASIWVMMLQVEPSGAISQKQKSAQDNVLVASFHPALTEDSGIHKYFVDEIVLKSR